MRRGRCLLQNFIVAKEPVCYVVVVQVTQIAEEIRNLNELRLELIREKLNAM